LKVIDNVDRACDVPAMLKAVVELVY
jgi:hypothetical protein